MNHVIASAGSLEDLADMFKKRWHWSVFEAIPTDDPKSWAICHAKGVSDTMRIRLHRGRYQIVGIND